MPLFDSLLNVGVTAMQAQATHLAIHTALPDATGSNQAASARLPASWPSAANGDFGTITNRTFTGGAANGAAKYLGFWSQLAVGGTFWGYLPLVGDAVFNASGVYVLTSLSIPGTAT